MSDSDVTRAVGNSKLQPLWLQPVEDWWEDPPELSREQIEIIAQNWVAREMEREQRESSLATRIVVEEETPPGEEASVSEEKTPQALEKVMQLKEFQQEQVTDPAEEDCEMAVETGGSSDLCVTSAAGADHGQISEGEESCKQGAMIISLAQSDVVRRPGRVVRKPLTEERRPSSLQRASGGKTNGTIKKTSNHDQQGSKTDPPLKKKGRRHRNRKKRNKRQPAQQKREQKEKEEEEDDVQKERDHHPLCFLWWLEGYIKTSPDH